MTGRRSDAFRAPMSGYAAGMGQDNRFWVERQYYIISQEETMKYKERLKSYDELPLVLDVADIQQVMGISRASAYELVHSPGFPSFRSGRLIKVSKRAFFDWMAQSREKGGAP